MIYAAAASVLGESVTSTIAYWFAAFTAAQSFPWPTCSAPLITVIETTVTVHGLELDELSMSATAISKIKYTVSKLASSDCKALLAEVMNMATTQDVRTEVEKFYRDKNI